MDRRKNIVFLITLLMIALCGCSSQPTPMDAAPPPRFVTQVDVVCQNGPQSLTRQYTSPEKIGSMLLYLRLLHPIGNADTDPELLTGNIFKITVHLSDGKQHVYYQQSDRYLSKDLQPWQQIEEKYADNLEPLLQSMSSDVAKTATGF